MEARVRLRAAGEVQGYFALKTDIACAIVVGQTAAPLSRLYMAIPPDGNPAVLSISVPNYSVETQPDYIRVGSRVDNFLGRHLQEGHHLVRTVSLADHPGKTIDELASLILASGTDRYDRDRKALEPEFDGYDYDLHLSLIEITEGEVVSVDGSMADEQLAERIGLTPQ
ncbi:MAG: hypothetical protein KJO98_06165, partial [Rhodothermia bacterium]|nr:hypothetical protein [Rhodothermia bacterium]